MVRNGSKFPTVESLCNAAITGDPGLVEMGAGSGGVSKCTTNSTTNTSTSFNPASCSGGYAKPSWQTGVTGIGGLSPEMEIVARTIYGEARSDGEEGMTAVAWVIRNRYHLGPLGGFGIGWIGVCKQRNQFQCWSVPGKNQNAMLDADNTDSAFQTAVTVASAVMGGAVADPTGGALFYYDHSIAEPASWVKAGYRQTVVIGPFTFLRGRFL